jgi:hypothetical protein
MTGIQFVTDEKGRKVGVLIDLKKHGAIWQDSWDGFVSESRRKEKGIPYEQYRAARLKRAPGAKCSRYFDAVTACSKVSRINRV